MADTPLGQTVSIRAEKDYKVIAKMTKYEKKIRAEWQRFKAKKQAQVLTQEQQEQNQRNLQNVLSSMFGKGR